VLFTRGVHSGLIIFFFWVLFIIRLFSIFIYLLGFVVVVVVVIIISVLAKIVNCLPFCLQLQDYDMCIAKNEEALRLQPRFAECYGNMANAWKVINITWVCVELWMCLIPLINDRDWLLMKVIFCLIILQEKGDIDRAIRYYLVSIEVSLQILNFFSPN